MRIIFKCLSPQGLLALCTAGEAILEGKYEEALRDWQQVLKIDENYRLANKGMAKVLMKAEEWKEAMTEYKKANDRDGYTNAFTEHRHQMFRRYFG